MKLAALLLVHRYPDQAANLIDTLLKDEAMRVYVHVDFKAEACFSELKSKFDNQAKVHFIENRYRVFWGSYGQIQATYALMQAAAGSNCDYAFLLSGQDYPIKPLSEFAKFLHQAAGKDFVVNFALPDKQWEGGGLLRLQYYHFDSQHWPWLIRKVTGQVHRFQKLFGIRRTINLPLFGGSNWFTISKASLQKVCEFIHANPSYLHMFKHSRCADEIFIQTALLQVVAASNIISENLHVIDWSTGPEYPRIWRIEDFDRLIKSDNKFFARKFDATVDKEILSKLQAHVTR